MTRPLSICSKKKQVPVILILMQKSVKQKHLDCLLGKFSYIHLVISAGSDLPQSFMAKNLCNFILSETKTVIRIIDTS